MKHLTSILAVVDRSEADADVLKKAVALARQSGASLELFLCDADRAYTFARAYDTTGIEEARQACLAECHRYLAALKASVTDGDVRISVDAACASPLYEAIVHKALKSRCDLVIKGAAGAQPMQRGSLDVNDWQLMRTCPVTLVVTRGRSWREHPRWAAAVDVSRQEAPELTRSILETSGFLARGFQAELDVLYCERPDSAADERKANDTSVHRLVRELTPEAARVEVLVGDPEQNLPAFAAHRHYDVFVIGALTHREGLVALVGTLTNRLVDALECDFVLVKPAGYRCPIEEASTRRSGETGDTRSDFPRPRLWGSPVLWQAAFGD